MALFILLLAIMIITSALVVLIGASLGLRAECRRFAGVGCESLIRLRDAMNNIRGEVGRLREDLTQLSAITTGIPMAISAVRETRLLRYNLKALGSVIMLLSTLRNTLCRN